MNGKSWYVVHTYSGYENKVKANLEKRVESMGMQDKIFRVVVPEEVEVEMKNGKEKLMKRKVFPGYVLVELIMTDDSWYVVRNTPGVTGFVGSSGSGSKPSPLLEEEVVTIMKHMGMDNEVVDFDFELHETVRVNEDHSQIIQVLLKKLMWRRKRLACLWTCLVARLQLNLTSIKLKNYKMKLEMNCKSDNIF